jgi:hypothetical protein
MMLSLLEAPLPIIRKEYTDLMNYLRFNERREDDRDKNIPGPG